MSTTDIVFNDQQLEGIQKVMQWFRGWQDRRHRKQVFFLAGYAGTGKTSLAKHIAEQCGGQHRVVFIAPTGKAASRLRQKGCKYAKTMHQFIYNVRGEDEDGDPIFIGKGAIDEKPVLIVLDEGSMVSDYDLRQLTSYNIAVLALGDLGQVPPVKAASALKPENVDHLLEQIERQGAESNIIRASMFVRQGKRLPVRSYDDVKVIQGEPSDADLLAHAGEDGQAICSFNSTRQALNRRFRKLLGFTGDIPQVGEKVVCTFNQHGHGFMNGEQGIVLNYVDIPDEDKEDEDNGKLLVRIKSLTDGRERQVKFNPASFDRSEDIRKEAYRNIGGFDYGYALTVHKSQGSEWPRVLVVEEIMRGNDYSKMMYTAITRAQEHLTVYRG